MVDSTDIITTRQSSDVIHCITIPLHEEMVLLPNAAIAEIVAYIEPTTIDDAPKWFLGYIIWREIRIPLIAIEAMSGKKVEAAKENSRIAVLNTLNGNADLAYVAILSQGIPSLALVSEDGIEEQTDLSDHSAIGAIVNVDGIDALIPDMDEIEQRLIDLNLV